jgi:hypothetical protein
MPGCQQAASGFSMAEAAACRIIAAAEKGCFLIN